MFKKLGKVALLSMLVIGSLNATSKYSNSCRGCHGISGEKAALGKSKIIKNMSAKEIKNALTGYKNGTYGGSMKGIMKGQVKSLSSSDIVEIADLIGKGGQLSLKHSSQSEPLTLSREDEKCVNLVNTVPENFWRQIVKKQECPKNRSYYKNISQKKQAEYKKAIALNKSVEVQKIIDSQGEYKNLSRKEALELFQKNTGISLYHKTIPSNKVADFCKKKGLSIPSFLNISEAKESLIKYKYHSSILELKKKGEKISENNLRFVNGDISMIVVNDRKNTFAYFKGFELSKEVGRKGISVIACKKSTKEDKLLAKKAKKLEEQENQEQDRLIKKYRVSVDVRLVVQKRYPQIPNICN